MALSEIEKLERRYQENPQGLTFAPLAEAYRKSGDPQRAIGVLTPGLELHPDYIPASIVLGRCHLDLKDDASAEQAFVHVLTLDTENVIALKALADITERGARFGDASRWLEQLLTVDRSNDEAREQLERVRSSHAQQASADSGAAAPGSAEAAEETASVPPLDGLEQNAVESLADDAFGEELPPLETVERETSGAAAVEAQPVEAFEPTVAATPEPPPVPMTDPSAVVLDDAILGVMQLGTSEEIVLSAAEHTEFQLPSASEGLGADAVPDATRSDASEYQLPSASEDLSTTPSLDAARGASEYQLPSASEELIPEAEAATGASEFQLPDASSDFGGSALTIGDTTATANEYQSPDVVADLLSPSRPPEPPAVSSGRDDGLPAALAEVFDEDEDTEPGEWVTWSDAALDADAEPFEPVAEEPAAPAMLPLAAAQVAPTVDVDSIAITEIMEIMSLAGDPPSTEIAEIVEMIEAAEAAEMAEAAEPELVVTESMAELFLKQGHPADALRIYRELLSRRPDDARLAERVATLEATEPASKPLPPYAASSSGGTSVRELMRTVLGSRPNGLEPARHASREAPATGAEAPGTPTRPAADHLTLSAIFGEDAAPLPPMSRKPRVTGPPPAERGGVSFDEFYGGSGAKPGPSPRPAGAPQGAGGDDDLDQFHDWLQNLKR